MSYIIALTGGICSGKSTVTKIFSKLPKVSIIDADIIAKEITQSNNYVIFSIAKYFGTNILLSNGLLNRKELKKRIFFNPEDRKWLERLLHPLIQKNTHKKINRIRYQSSYILWVVPLLIEKNLQKLADRILVIDVCPNIQLTRLINREKINELYAEKILLSQSIRKIRLKHANDIIDNNNHIQDIKSQILNLHNLYLTLKSLIILYTIFYYI